MKAIYLLAFTTGMALAIVMLWTCIVAQLNGGVTRIIINSVWGNWEVALDIGSLLLVLSVCGYCLVREVRRWKNNNG